MKLQNFLSISIPKAAADLEAALLGLPADKRNWSAGGQARTALDMFAEVALLNGGTADILHSRQGMPDFDLADFNRQKTALFGDWPALQKLLHDNTARVVAAIGVVPDSDWEVEVAMPWGPMTLADLAAYPYWNAKYHEGQINFIASILGELK